jgi:DNA uptake protein ComE-like DNA-binding protein
MDIRAKKNRVPMVKPITSATAVDLNDASEEELANLPMLRKQRARDLISHRPFSNWEEVEKVPGFSKWMVDDLKSGNARLGGGQ